jgi:hypothetical protein
MDRQLVDVYLAVFADISLRSTWRHDCLVQCARPRWRGPERLLLPARTEQARSSRSKDLVAARLVPIVNRVSDS